MSSLNRASTLLATLALVAGLTGRTIASTIIDTFDVDQFVPASGNNPTSASDSKPGGTILGSNRGLFVEKTAGSIKPSKTVKGDVDASISLFTISRDAGIGGRALVQWDGDTTAPSTFSPLSNLSFNLGGGPGVDLTTGGEVGLLLKIFGADIAGQQVRFTLFGPNATVASDAVVTLPAVNGGPIDVQIPFAAFSQTLIVNGGAFNAASPASASQVYAVTMAITGPDSSDISIGTLSTYAPEPTSATLLSLGGLGGVLSLSRKRLRQRRTTTE